MPSSAGSLNAIAFGSGRLVAVGTAGAISTSTDGTTWTAATSGTAEYLLGVEYLNNGFVATGTTGVVLTESCAMHPGAAVCGLYFSHPDSHYFAISELQRDQIEDYARRKLMPVSTVEQWLGPWLGY